MNDDFYENDGLFDDMSVDEELELDAYLEAVTEQIQQEQPKEGVLDALRWSQMTFCQRVMAMLAKRTPPCEIKCEQGELMKTLWSVSTLAKDFVCYTPEWFARAAEFSDNMEIYPRTDKKLMIAFGFHNMIQPMDNAEEVLIGNAMIASQVFTEKDESAVVGTKASMKPAPIQAGRLSELADSLSAERDLERVEFKMMQGHLVLLIENDDFVTYNGRSDPFFKLLEGASGFRISRLSSDRIRIKIWFPSAQEG